MYFFIKFADIQYIMSKLIKIIFFLFICFALSKSVFSKLNGSPGAKTNSPTDGNDCTVCHSGTANTGNGSVSINTNIPSNGYTPGQTYSIDVQISQSSINRFGFEITSEENNFGSGKIGSFGITDPNSTKFTNNNNAITHKQTGITGNGARTWNMNWTAPTTNNSGGVIFYVSAIAANGNGNSSGDEIYTTSRGFSEATSTVNNEVSDIKVFLNISNNDIMINSNNPVLISDLKIYDVSSKLVYNKKNTYLPALIKNNLFNPGIYILKMQTSKGKNIQEKIILP